MKRRNLITIAIAIAAAAATPAAVRAQPADAIGHPLPSSDLPDGTVQVKVIAGSVAKPVNDTDVHVAIGGVDHTARTNAEGHATLPGVAAGQSVRITVKGADGKPDIASDEFPMPDHGGVKVMLTTAPMDAQPGMGGGAMAGGRPEPRMMSGKGRPDQGVDPGTLIATVTYDSLDDKTPPAGVPVLCVGYSDDTGVTVKIEKTDSTGRAMFTKLDRSGATAYFLLVRLPRFDGTATVIDRLETVPPIQLDGTAGWRVMMSGEKRDSTKPGVDELSTIEAPADVPAGKVMVSIAGAIEDKASAQLVDAATGKVVANAPLAPEVPKHVVITTSPLQKDPQGHAGSLGVQLIHTSPQSSVPVADTRIRLRAAPPRVTDPLGAAAPAAPIAPATEPGDLMGELTSAKDGYAQFDKLPTGAAMVAEVTLGADTVRSTPFTLPADAGQVITLSFTWDQRGQLSAMFDAPAPVGDAPNAVFYVKTEMFKKTFRSEPFQLLPDKGTASSILVYPRVFLQFALDANAEDDFLAVRGEMAVRNFSWAPYKGGDDGVSVPLPDGFKGAGVVEEAEVAKDTDGYRIVKPLPPFGLTFHVGWSMPISHEEAEIDWPMPSGVLQGDFAVHEFPPGVEVQPPTDIGSMQTETITNKGGSFFVMHGLTVMPSPAVPVPRLHFTVTGLPSPPAWKVLGPKIAGLVVIALLVFTAGFTIRAALKAGKVRAGDKVARKQRIDSLYEQLVAIDRGGADPGARDAIMAELEGLVAAEHGKAS